MASPVNIVDTRSRILGNKITKILNSTQLPPQATPLRAEFDCGQKSFDFSARFYPTPNKKVRQIAKISVYVHAKFHGSRLNTFGMATFLLFDLEWSKYVTRKLPKFMRKFTN